MQKTSSHGPGASPAPFSPTAPIEREETVMVPGPGKREHAPKTFTEKKTSLKETKPEPRSMEASSESKSRDTKTAESESILEPPVIQSATKGTPEVTGPVAPVVEEKSEAKFITVKSPDSDDKADFSPEAKTVEETLLTEQPQGAVVRKTRPAGVEKKIPVERQEPPPITEQNYFTRTAEIIGGREAPPQEVQTILLREIQEWVTAGEHSHDIDSPLDKVPEEIETQGIVEMTETEPGVVRIGQKRNSASSMPGPESQSPGLEEQSFDLSIGTISVVIEEDTNTLQAAPAPQSQSGQGRQEASNRFSRLKRSLL